MSNETSLSKEKFLIVVGRMGHGKSSFCKMIVDDSEKGKIKAKADVQSVTLESNFYVSNCFDNIFDGKINVLDTPGLDS